MSLTYKKATRRPSVFRRLTTYTVDEFDTLVKKLRPEWDRREHARLAERTDRVRAVGQGRPYAGSFETMVLLAVLYLRTPAGNVFLSLLFGIDEVTVRTWRKRILPLLSDRFIPDTEVTGKRKRINDLDEFLKEYPELKELIGDGCELKTQRPKRKQGKNYTGKSKRHVKKFVLVTNRTDGLILARTVIRPGSVHDKRVLDEDPLHKRLDKRKDLLKRFDSAWTGEDPTLGYVVNKRGRRGHPLGDKDKRANKKLSKIRIIVEHAIRRVKTFRRLAETVVIHMAGGFDAALDAAINLANFTVLVRQTKTA
jgi:hypothetical protein